MSPRSTHALHERGEIGHLASVLLIGLQGGYLSGQGSPLPEATCTVEKRATDGFRSAHAGRLKLRECLQSFWVQADADGG